MQAAGALAPSSGDLQVQRTQHGWKVRNKNQFLSRVMEALAGNATISFEGGTSILGLSAIPGAQEEESSVLKRNTLAPRQTFLIVPLEPATLTAIWKGIGGTVSRDVLHIQIDKGGRLAFAAYDRFHPGCLVFDPSIVPSLLESLVNEGLLEKSAQQLF
jgi:hypothetical protein